jgi:hypothetical protein
MQANPFHYDDSCKYCGVWPFSEGPHHKEDCPRYQSYMAYESELSHKYPCKFCGVVPFIAGAHHKRDCLRWIPEQMSEDSDLGAKIQDEGN